jgi:hypothetical protein
VARPYVRNIKPNEAKEIFGNLSQTNHYQVSFSGLNYPITNHIKFKFGIEDVDRFMGTKGGIMCSDASLPSSSLATGEVRNDFIGVPQEFAHTRLYTDIDFTFYIDNDYKILRIFEGWIDYISSGSNREIDELSDNYYRRMRYPDTYKVQSMFISKFEKDYKQQLDYQFVNAFPKLMTAIPVSYGGADILKVSVSFNYDRYIVNPRGRIRQNRASFDPLRAAVSAELQQSSAARQASLSASGESLPTSTDNRFLGPPTAKKFLGVPLNSQQTLNELYEAGRSGKIKSASEFIGPLQ